MEQPEKKLNLQISKYYTEHACQLSSTNEVAALLELPASRVSELRGGRRQLTVAQAEKIKEIFGLPSDSEGHWLECELLSSQNLHKQFIDNGLALHFLQIMEMMNSKQFIDAIVECCSFSDPAIEGYQSPIGLNSEVRREVEKKNDNIFRQYKLKYFNQLLASDSFKAYCDSENTVFDPEFFYNLCLEINPHFSFSYRFNPNYIHHVFKFLKALRSIRELCLSNTYSNLVTFDEGFNVGGRCKIINRASPKKEYVILGKIVWELGSESPLRLAKPIANEGVCGLQAEEKILHFSEAVFPKIYTEYSLKLYYSELYKYFLELNLYESESFIAKRQVLVEIADRNKIFDELLNIFNYFHIETAHTLTQIKSAVAQNGGYIPGAIYLD